jgi:deazaflavin-dependent oxidoreductase (nitroreductase family)
MTAGQSIQRLALRVHQAIYVWSRGYVGHRLIGVPSLLLQTTGRRTGRLRTTALIYARDGTQYVMVASNHGLGRDPAWLLNIEADPAVEIQVGRRREHGVARVIERGDPEYGRLWQLVNEGNHHRYERYQASTDRPIPLVVVSPGVSPGISPGQPPDVSPGQPPIQPPTTAIR